MSKWKKVICIGGVGFLLWFRYLFVLVPMNEEAAAGGLVEVKVGKVLRTLDERIIFSQEEDEKVIKIGKNMSLIFQAHWPKVKIRYKNKEFPFAIVPYSGFLPILTNYSFTLILGKNIYTFKLMLLFSFMIFLWMYIELPVFNGKNILERLLLSIFFLSFPLVSIGTINFILIFPLYFIFITAIFNRIYRILESGEIKPVDFLSLSFFGGILFQQIFMGGGIFVAMFLSLLRCVILYRIKIDFKPIYAVIGGLLFVFLAAPHTILFLFYGGFAEKIEFPFPIPFKELLIKFLYALFGASTIFHLMLENKLGWEFIPLSFFSGSAFILCIYALIKFRKGRIENFICWTLIIYMFFLGFGKFVRIDHYIPIFLFLAPFFFHSLSLFKNSKIYKGILFLLVFCNFVQIEMLRKDVLRSFLSYPFHKKVVEYLEKENIKKVYNFLSSGIILAYDLLSGKGIEVVNSETVPSSSTESEEIYRFLIATKGEIILTGRKIDTIAFKGAGIDGIREVAEKRGMKVRVIKEFPHKSNPTLFLIKVEDEMEN